MSEPGRRFYRITAVCSFVSAITTLGLIFLPRLYPHPVSLEGQTSLLKEPAYGFRMWIYFCHPFFTFSAALGVALANWRRRLALVLPGILGFAVWAYTEALQQSLSLVANHYTWRTALNATTDASVRNMALAQMYGFEAIWDALYFLLLVGFIAGNTFYATALWSGERLERTLALFFLAAVGLSIFNLLGVFGIATQSDRYTNWAYPLLQPAARALIGLYLWQVAAKQGNSGAQTSIDTF